MNRDHTDTRKEMGAIKCSSPAIESRVESSKAERGVEHSGIF